VLLGGDASSVAESGHIIARTPSGEIHPGFMLTRYHGYWTRCHIPAVCRQKGGGRCPYSLKRSAQRNETGTKPFGNSSETVLQLFCFAVSFRCADIFRV